MKKRNKHLFLAVIFIMFGVIFTSSMKESTGSLGMIFIIVGVAFFIIGMAKRIKEGK